MLDGQKQQVFMTFMMALMMVMVDYLDSVLFSYTKAPTGAHVFLPLVKTRQWKIVLTLLLAILLFRS